MEEICSFATMSYTFTTYIDIQSIDALEYGITQSQDVLHDYIQ